MFDTTGYEYVVGIDEVGRGPLVGDVVTCGVILDSSNPIEGLCDSKKLTPKRRSYLSEKIKESAISWNVGAASSKEIDDINILNATMLAMQRAVGGLSVLPDLALVDGNRTPQLDCEVRAIVKGDSLVQSISAASIIAKVSRDNQMQKLHDMFPEYGFGKHKGYPTKEHLSALLKYGPLWCHRVSFKPVAIALDKFDGEVRKA